MDLATSYLEKIVDVEIDRPLGSKHPKHGFIYTVNYGFVPNTTSGDGEEIDCYVLGIFEPIERFTGKCIAVIHRTNDNDDKLIIVPENTNFSDEQIRALTAFQEHFFESKIIRHVSLNNILTSDETSTNSNIDNHSDNNLIFNKNLPELSVTNLDKSLEFYKTAGFKIEYERPENKFAFISLGEIQFMLQEIRENEKWELAPLTYPFGNGINFQLDVKNVDEIYNNLKNNNYNIAFDIEENWYRQDNKLLGCREFLIQDPDGYLLRFSKDLGEKNI